jgi:hypothetical protein
MLALEHASMISGWVVSMPAGEHDEPFLNGSNPQSLTPSVTQVSATPTRAAMRRRNRAAIGSTHNPFR